MKVKELIEILEDYPNATVNISMEGVFTDEVYISDISEKNVMIEEIPLGGVPEEYKEQNRIGFQTCKCGYIS